jgi:hypothetical protein
MHKYCTLVKRKKLDTKSLVTVQIIHTVKGGTMYKKIKEAEIPKRERKSESRFEKTPEWLAMKADIDRGLKAKEALQVALTDADKLKYRISNRRTVARFVKKYLDEKDLRYSVKSFRSDDMDFIVVRH